MEREDEDEDEEEHGQGDDDDLAVVSGAIVVDGSSAYVVEGWGDGRREW